eukprot:Opistho-1_new@16201
MRVNQHQTALRIRMSGLGNGRVGHSIHERQSRRCRRRCGRSITRWYSGALHVLFQQARIVAIVIVRAHFGVARTPLAAEGKRERRERPHAKRLAHASAPPAPSLKIGVVSFIVKHGRRRTFRRIADAGRRRRCCSCRPAVRGESRIGVLAGVVVCRGRVVHLVVLDVAGALAAAARRELEFAHLAKVGLSRRVEHGLHMRPVAPAQCIRLQAKSKCEEETKQGRESGLKENKSKVPVVGIGGILNTIDKTRDGRCEENEGIIPQRLDLFLHRLLALRICAVVRAFPARRPAVHARDHNRVDDEEGDDNGRKGHIPQNEPQPMVLVVDPAPQPRGTVRACGKRHNRDGRREPPTHGVKANLKVVGDDFLEEDVRRKGARDGTHPQQDGPVKVEQPERLEATQVRRVGGVAHNVRYCLGHGSEVEGEDHALRQPVIALEREDERHDKECAAEGEDAHRTAHTKDGRTLVVMVEHDARAHFFFSLRAPLQKHR